jgi:hypothetical protein
MAKTIRAKCLDAIQLLSRLKASDDNGYCQCVTCDAVKHYKEMDGGHFIPKGSCSYWSLREENVHPQCKGCNGFGMKHGSAALSYTLWMIDYYGRDFVDEMEALKKTKIKIYANEYREMLSNLVMQIKEHKSRVGG